MELCLYIMFYFIFRPCSKLLDIPTLGLDRDVIQKAVETVASPGLHFIQSLNQGFHTVLLRSRVFIHC